MLACKVGVLYFGVYVPVFALCLKFAANLKIMNQVYYASYCLVNDYSKEDTCDSKLAYIYEEGRYRNNADGSEHLGIEHPAGISAPPDSVADYDISRLGKQVDTY